MTILKWFERFFLIIELNQDFVPKTLCAKFYKNKSKRLVAIEDTHKLTFYFTFPERISLASLLVELVLNFKTDSLSYYLGFAQCSLVLNIL